MVREKGTVGHPTFFSKTGIAQRGIQGELTEHLRVTLVLTLFTFWQKSPMRLMHFPSHCVKHTCPPGPELLEKASSTSCLGIFVCGELNLASQSDALVLSSSVTRSVRDGGFGNTDDGGGAVKIFLEKIDSPNLFKDTVMAEAVRVVAGRHNYLKLECQHNIIRIQDKTSNGR
jgi:hypothetical protein